MGGNTDDGSRQYAGKFVVLVGQYRNSLEVDQDTLTKHTAEGVARQVAGILSTTFTAGTMWQNAHLQWHCWMLYKHKANLPQVAFLWALRAGYWTVRQGTMSMASTYLASLAALIILMKVPKLKLSSEPGSWAHGDFRGCFIGENRVFSALPGEFSPFEGIISPLLHRSAYWNSVVTSTGSVQCDFRLPPCCIITKNNQEAWL